MLCFFQLDCSLFSLLLSFCSASASSLSRIILRKQIIQTAIHYFTTKSSNLDSRPSGLESCDNSTERYLNSRPCGFESRNLSGKDTGVTEGGNVASVRLVGYSNVPLLTALG